MTSGETKKVDVEETFKNSKIETVLVYKSSALITRSFEFNLKSFFFLQISKFIVSFFL